MHEKRKKSFDVNVRTNKVENDEKEGDKRRLSASNNKKNSKRKWRNATKQNKTVEICKLGGNVAATVATAWL